MAKGLILLDRDGVLNRLRVDPEQGTIDSPLHPSQVELYEDAVRAAAALAKEGFALAIVTNQPAAAKGKTTRENLCAAHEVVVNALKRAGAPLVGSYICFHRAEDRCDCRKPKAKLLEEALGASGADRARSWMVGDGLTDVQAGQAAGVHAAFLGPQKLEHRKVFEERGVALPELWCESLAEFVDKLKER